MRPGGSEKAPHWSHCNAIFALPTDAAGATVGTAEGCDSLYVAVAAVREFGDAVEEDGTGRPIIFLLASVINNLHAEHSTTYVMLMSTC